MLTALALMLLEERDWHSKAPVRCNGNYDCWMELIYDLGLVAIVFFLAVWLIGTGANGEGGSRAGNHRPRSK